MQSKHLPVILLKEASNGTIVSIVRRNYHSIPGRPGWVQAALLLTERRGDLQFLYGAETVICRRY